VVDATHVEAAAALKSLRAELQEVAEREPERAGVPSDEPEEGSPPAPGLQLAPPRSGPTPQV
jgi:hypothetical protein